ncbi:MAG: hypothetical protein ACRCX2_22860 [Paraclostridium sp.]
MNDKLKKETYIDEIRANISDTFGVNINDNFTDYDDIVDIISEYFLSVDDVYENYDKYVTWIVNEEYEEMNEETLLNIHIEFINRVNKKYDVSVDIESIGIETYFIAIFDEAMYQVINDNNPMSIAQIFDMIDDWIKEIDEYIYNTITK